MGEFNSGVLELSKSKLVVVDFTATWCGPCQTIAPVFAKLAEDHPGSEFVKVDVDDAADVAAHCKISSMPTFHLYKGGATVEEFSGADKLKLLELVQKHA